MPESVKRGPTTTTLRAVEQLLRKRGAPMSRYEIRQALPTRIAAPLLDEALAYLHEHAIVLDEGPGGKVEWNAARPETSAVRVAAEMPVSRRPRLARLVRTYRREILTLAKRHGVATVRLFGSVARGEEGPESDVDLLIRMEAGRSLLDHIAFQQDVEELLGVKVDVVSEGGISPYIRDRVLEEAVPV